MKLCTSEWLTHMGLLDAPGPSPSCSQVPVNLPLPPPTWYKEIRFSWLLIELHCGKAEKLQLGKAYWSVVLPLWLLLALATENSALCVRSPPLPGSPACTPKAAVPDTCPRSGPLRLPEQRSHSFLVTAKFHFPKPDTACMRSRQTDSERLPAPAATVAQA